MNNKNFLASLNWVFFGSDRFSIIVLEELLAHGLKPNLIITTPDKPSGRHLKLTSPLVKTWANDHQIECLQPTEFNSDLLTKLKDQNKFGLVASYGLILPNKILDLWPAGLLNIHPSLLPKYRGASPIQQTILSNDNQAGVSLIKLDALMDHGPIIASQSVPLNQKNYFDLETELAKLGSKLIIDFLPLYLNNKLELIPQNHDLATYTKKITKTDGELDLNDSAKINDKKIRAYINWPGTYFYITKNDKPIRVKITKAYLDQDQLIIERVIPAGKKEMAWLDFKRNL